MRRGKARLVQGLQSMSGLLFPAVRVNFSLATLVRHTLQRDRGASNSHSVIAACLSFITPPRRCVQQHPRRKGWGAPEPNTLITAEKWLRESAHSFTSLPLMPLSFCLVPNFIGRNRKCAHGQTNRLRARAQVHAHAHKTPIYLPVLSNPTQYIVSGTRPRHWQSRAQVQMKTCTLIQIKAQSQTNLFLCLTCPRALPWIHMKAD